ncbi:MAG: flippase-like domain-containing protein [Oligoflexia bacterium]|nr:flippase-like domain-containing protein [Oligoflexia bacterium]
MNSRLKALTINFAKFGLAAVLIFWLVKSEKITFDPFKLLFEKWWLIPFALGSVLIVILVNNYRWVLLLRGQKINKNWFSTLRLTFIGLFFNLVMPGSVGGDVLKAYYISKDHPQTKMKSVTSIIVDRIVGLYAIIVIAFLAIIFNFEKLSSQPQLKSLSVFIVVLFIGFSVFFTLSFSRRIRKNKITKFVLEKIPGGRLIEKLYDALNAFRNGTYEFIVGILLSLFAQTQLIFSLYVLAQELHFDTSLRACFFIIPIGFIATAIPVSPAGIGVGQAVFFKLFQWYGGVDTVLGPTLITINQICFAIFKFSRSHFLSK